jgi:radical SAM superfamily enzyme YgiQ (UPF0313 family)
MKKFVLLNPPLTEEERGSKLKSAIAVSIPYGLLSIAAVVREHGYAVSLIDATNLGYTTEETVRRILALDPDYVGITTVTLSIDRCAEVATGLKAGKPGLPVIAGGPHISSAPKETMRLYPSLDIGVIGEGEETIVELLNALDEGRPLARIRGIIHRLGNEIVHEQRRPFLANLDDLPMPAWDILSDMKMYRPSAPSYVRLPSTTIVTSRGCPGRCIFCNSKAMYGNLRCFSAAYVLSMIEHLVETYGIRDISIYDDNFLFHEDRVREICNSILKNRMDLTWSCYSRVDHGNLELFKLMKKAGCWQVSYGIESGSQRILDSIKKDVTLSQISDTVRMTKRAGLRSRGFFIIGHLQDDQDSVLETIEFMRRLPLDDFHFTTFTPLPGTVAYATADQFGAFDRTWSKMNLQYPCFIPKGLTAERMEELSRMAYRKFYFRPRILGSYLSMLARHPGNVRRLTNGASALLTRVFSS